MVKGHLTDCGIHRYSHASFLCQQVNPIVVGHTTYVYEPTLNPSKNRTLHGCYAGFSLAM